MGRMEKVNQQLKREISSILQREMSDPRFAFVTVTGVDTSKDLRHARVYFTVLGDENQLKKAQEGLNRASRAIRGLVGKQIKIRYTPELSFLYDKSQEVSDRIEKTLEDIRNEAEENH